MPYHCSEEHTSELQSPCNLVCRLLLEKKKNNLTVRRAQEAALARRTRVPSGDLAVRLREEAGISVSFCVPSGYRALLVFFFFNDTATTEIYTLSLHDALPIYQSHRARGPMPVRLAAGTVRL